MSALSRAESIHCEAWSCRDVSQSKHLPVKLPVDAEAIRVVVVLDPVRLDDVEAGEDDPLSPTVAAAFLAAGYDVTDRDDFDRLGVYVTGATKCPKVGYGLRNETIGACSHLLEAELDRFPNLHAIVLAGDAPIRAINAISYRRYGQPAVPRGPAYKVMGHEYQLGRIRLIPSYPPRGGHAVETDGLAMIAVDLSNALESAPPSTRPERPRPNRSSPSAGSRSRDQFASPTTPGPPQGEPERRLRAPQQPPEPPRLHA